VLGDELFLAADRDLASVAPGGEGNLAISSLESPPVGHLADGRGAPAGDGDAMTHRDGEIVFALENPGRHGDGGAPHQLLDEGDCAAPALARAPPNVEAQIHFLEIVVPRNRSIARCRHSAVRKTDRESAIPA
jgi:hypothetical protein